jgi:hypothetical protein
VDINGYSKSKVGEQWTEVDHIWLMEQIRKVDELAQAAYNMRESGATAKRNAPVQSLEITDEDAKR